MPDVVDGLYGEAVLVQAMSGGRRVDDPAVRAQGHELADHLLEAYLYQFLALGAFHVDPHPGNLFVMADGRLCFHDFGLVGHLDREQRRGIAAFVGALVQLDADWLLDAYLDLGLVEGAAYEDVIAGSSSCRCTVATLEMQPMNVAARPNRRRTYRSGDGP